MKFENGNIRKWVLLVYLGLACVLVVAVLAFAAFQVPVEDAPLDRAFLIWTAVGALLVKVEPTPDKVAQMDVDADTVNATEKD